MSPLAAILTSLIAQAVPSPAEMGASVAPLVERVKGSVVTIQSSKVIPRVAYEDPMMQFFRHRFGLGQAPARRETQRGLGSGFVVSKTGVVLTNNHVVAGADQIRVFLSDRRYFDATLVGNDPFTDVAVIKINAGQPLPAISFGNSDAVKVGEWILAVGNPGFGNSTQLDYTVTAGIVSARGRGLGLLNRDLEQDSRYGPDMAGYAIEDFIQTDAVINPGNSGGPMVNLKGQVVGINSAIASPTGYYTGYGFAIPINLARRIMQDLIENGRVRRPAIGVTIQNVAAEDAEQYGLPKVSGVLVQEVRSGTPSVGKLQREDVIVALDGEPVGYVAELQAKIAARHPGDQVKLTVYRNKRPTEVTIRLDEAPINERPVTTAEREVMAEERLGINVEPLTADLAQQLGYEQAGGVVITGVQRTSPAARRGVPTRVKLTQVNDTPISTPDDVRRALASVESGQIVSLHIVDQTGSTRVYNVRMP